jgi:Dolichyl-phosphate-mannose-protein mannosyltransferase
MGDRRAGEDRVGPLTRAQWVALAAIVLLGAMLRFGRIEGMLPSIDLPDEELVIKNALSLPARKTLEPLYFDYPTFHIYLLAVTEGALFATGRLAGFYRSAADFGVKFFVDPTPVYLVGRALAALMSTATIAVAFALGRRLYGTLAGLLGALLLALSIESAREAAIATPNPALTFLAALAFLPIVQVARRGRLRDYVVAGGAIGLGVSAKYNCGLLVLPLVLAHFWPDRDGEASRRPILWLAAALGIAAAVFLAVTPYWILSFDEFLAQYSLQASHMRTGHIGHMGRAPLLWALEDILRQERTAGLFAIIGIALAAMRRRLGDRLLLAFVLPSFLTIASLKNQQLDYLAFLWPPAAVLGGRALASLLRLGPIARSRALTAAIAVAVLAPSTAGALAELRRANRADTREVARAWIEANIPAGAGIAFDDYHRNAQLLDAGRAKRSQLGREHMDADFLQSVESALASRRSYRLVRIVELADAPNLPSQIDSLPDPSAFRARVARDHYLSRQVFATRSLPLDELATRGAEYLLLSSRWVDRFLVLPPPPRENPLYFYWLRERAYLEGLLADPRLAEVRRWEPGPSLGGPRIVLYRIAPS